MNNPLVSVIIPCFNQAQYLEDALNSILIQTYSNWECIIINDGSTDNTEKIANIWMKKDKRFKYIYSINKGPSASRNIGLNIANGNYIQFLDSDDVIHPEKLEIQINLLKTISDDALCISDYFSSVAEDLTFSHEWYLSPRFSTDEYLIELISKWEIELSIPIHCFLFKSNLFKGHNIFFNESLPNHVDWECWMNIFRLKPEVKFINLKLATYRIQPIGISRNLTLMKKGYLQAIKIQKTKFSRFSTEYKLLTKRYYLLKYGINSGCFLIVLWKYFYIRSRKFISQIKRQLFD